MLASTWGSTAIPREDGQVGAPVSVGHHSRHMFPRGASWTHPASSSWAGGAKVTELGLQPFGSVLTQGPGHCGASQEVKQEGEGKTVESADIRYAC